MLLEEMHCYSSYWKDSDHCDIGLKVGYSNQITSLQGFLPQFAIHTVSHSWKQLEPEIESPTLQSVGILLYQLSSYNSKKCDTYNTTQEEGLSPIHGGIWEKKITVFLECQMVLVQDGQK